MITKELGWPPYILYLFWAVILSLPYFAFGPWSFLYLPDEGNNVVPLSLVAAERIFDLGPSGWSPELNAGTDVLANQVMPGFHGVLYLLLPGWVAYALQHILQYFVGGYFSYRILREQFVDETKKRINTLVDQKALEEHKLNLFNDFLLNL